MFKDKIISSRIGRGGFITWIMTSTAHSGFTIPLHLIKNTSMSEIDIQKIMKI